MRYFIGRIRGPEERTEARLSRRVRKHVNSIETVLGGTELQARDLPEFQDELADSMGELAFNLRRLIEVRREVPTAKNITLGYGSGKKCKSLQDLLGVCNHLLAFHILTGESGRYDLTSMLVVHSDRDSIGFHLKDLKKATDKFCLREPKRHFGLFSSDLQHTHCDSEGYPEFPVMISTRMRAISYDDFFWTPLERISPGLTCNPEFGLESVLHENPSLESDPIFKAASANAIWAKRDLDK